MSHARRQLLLCSFSSVDIGFCTIPSADASISLEVCRRIYHCKIQVKGVIIRSDY